MSEMKKKKKNGASPYMYADAATFPNKVTVATMRIDSRLKTECDKESPAAAAILHII